MAFFKDVIFYIKYKGEKTIKELVDSNSRDQIITMEFKDIEYLHDFYVNSFNMFADEPMMDVIWGEIEDTKVSINKGGYFCSYQQDYNYERLKEQWANETKVFQYEQIKKEGYNNEKLYSELMVLWNLKDVSSVNRELDYLLYRYNYDTFENTTEWITADSIEYAKEKYIRRLQERNTVPTYFPETPMVPGYNINNVKVYKGIGTSWIKITIRSSGNETFSMRVTADHEFYMPITGKYKQASSCLVGEKIKTVWYSDLLKDVLNAHPEETTFMFFVVIGTIIEKVSNLNYISEEDAKKQQPIVLALPEPVVVPGDPGPPPAYNPEELAMLSIQESSDLYKISVKTYKNSFANNILGSCYI